MTVAMTSVRMKFVMYMKVQTMKITCILCVCMYVHITMIYIYIYTHTHIYYMYMYICIFKCANEIHDIDEGPDHEDNLHIVCVYVCSHYYDIYIYIYIYIHTHTHT